MDNNTDITQEQTTMIPTFEQWLAGNGYKPKPCNCGGPQYGTDHSPDCESEISILDLQDLYDDDMLDRFEFDD